MYQFSALPMPATEGIKPKLRCHLSAVRYFSSQETIVENEAKTKIKGKAHKLSLSLSPGLHQAMNPRAGEDVIEGGSAV